ncbi:MAG: proprotein convertase P-domain-containing protein [Candidatus Binatia bacterium]
MASVARSAQPSFPGLASVSARNDESLPIPDNDPSGVQSLITIPGVTGTIVDVDVTIDLTHPSPGQLRIELISPSGTVVTLSTNNGGTKADAFTGTTFDDQTPVVGGSTPNVRNFTFASLAPNAPVTQVQPEEALGALVGEPADGPYGLASTWLLVVRDDTGGSAGTLRAWSLQVGTLPAGSLKPGTPAAFAFDAGTPGTTITDNNATGVSFPLTVSGLGPRIYRVEVTVDVTHPNSGDLEFLLASPSGRQIDLETRIGGGNDDLYAGATFADTAGTPIGDMTLPASPTAFGRVAGEGALAAFMGEDPNGQWTLVAKDRAGGNTGRLRSWTLSVTTTSACGDGVVDGGEACDDGNLTNGDGCDDNCAITGCGNGVVTSGEDCDDGNTTDGDTCPATCRLAESACDDCSDNDGDGLTDAADPGCATGTLTIRKAKVTKRSIEVAGLLSSTQAPAGPLSLIFADANGTVLCGAIGDVGQGRRGRRVRGQAGGGRISVTLGGRNGERVAIRGRGLDLSAFSGGNLTVGLGVGSARFAGTGTLRGRRRGH